MTIFLNPIGVLVFWRYRRNVALMIRVVREINNNKLYRASRDKALSCRRETVVDSQRNCAGTRDSFLGGVGCGREEMAQTIPGGRPR